VVICLAACLAGRKNKWSINRPVGRGFIALGCGSKQWIEDRLQQVFHRWGYHRITNLERLDTLMAGGAIQQSTVIQLQNAEEELGLRPELTADRTHGCNPNGWWNLSATPHNANVFRRTPEATTIGSRSSIKRGGIAGHAGLAG